MRDGDDSIAQSSTDDMFAFSQIIAGGQNPMQVANQIEKEAKKPVVKKIGGLDEDQAVAAYAEFMSSGGTLEVDPKIQLDLKRKLEKE